MTKEQSAFLIDQLDKTNARGFYFKMKETAAEKKLRHELDRMQLERNHKMEEVKFLIENEYSETKMAILEGDWIKGRAAVAKFKNFMRGYR